MESTDLTGAKRVALSINQETHDIEFDEQNGLVMVRDAEAVAQHTRQRLMTHRGEWFLDIVAGVPWLTEIMGRAYDAALAEAVIKGEILQTDQVTGIESFSIGFNRTTRGIEASNIAISTTFSDFPISI